MNDNKEKTFRGVCEMHYIPRSPNSKHWSRHLLRPKPNHRLEETKKYAGTFKTRLKRIKSQLRYTI